MKVSYTKKGNVKIVISYAWARQLANNTKLAEADCDFWDALDDLVIGGQETNYRDEDEDHDILPEFPFDDPTREVSTFRAAEPKYFINGVEFQPVPK